MRRSCLVIALVLLTSVSATAQTAAGSTQLEQIQEVANSLFPKHERAAVFLKDLSYVDGHVVRLEPNGFQLGAKKKSKFGILVHYSDILAISSKKRSLSLIPHPQTPNYGKWDDVTQLAPNTLIEITHKNGEVTSGRFRTGGDDHMIVAHPEKNDEWKLMREDVAYVHRVRYGYRDISGGLTSGAGKGEKVGTEVGKAAGQIRLPISGQQLGNGRGTGGAAMGAAVGAAVGVLFAAMHKSGTYRVLLYSP
ncbi:MAG TPA: hypothetical protein VL501_03570 [Pyrinomonadaceae bacterium]|nr:hypothetical protein [Pyrinomonadaceae bacterium]